MPREKSRYRDRDRRSSSYSSESSYDRKKSKSKHKRRSRSKDRSESSSYKRKRSSSRSRRTRRSYSRSTSRDRYESKSARKRSGSRSRGKTTKRSNSRSSSISRSKYSRKHKKRSYSSESRSPSYEIERPQPSRVNLDDSEIKLEKAIKAAEAVGLTMTRIPTYEYKEVEIKEDMPTITDRNLLEEINSDSFVQKPFTSTRAKKQNIVIDLDTQTVTVPEADVKAKEEDSILNYDALPSEEELKEMWIKKLYIYRKKMLKGDTSRTDLIC